MHQDAKKILKDFSEALGLTPEEIIYGGSKRELVDARFIIVTEIKKKMEGAVSLSVIGSWFKKPRTSAHTFVIYCEKQSEALKTDKPFQDKYQKCLATVFDLSIYNHIPQY